jgi:hypothetical protein
MNRTTGTPTVLPDHKPQPRRSRRGKVVALTLSAAMATALVGAMTGSASASSTGGSTVANVGVNPGITLTGLTSSFLLTGAPGATVSGAGIVAYNVETNNVAGYAVTVESTSATLQPAGGGNLDSIPIAALTVRQSGAGSYSPLSNSTAVTVHTQSSRSANGGDNLSNDYQIRIPVVNADTYSATLNYVASTL